MYKDDQLVTPVSLQVGMSLRLVAEELEMPLAEITRQILRAGLEHVREEIRLPYQKKLEELKKLNSIELAKLKQKHSKPKNRKSL